MTFESAVASEPGAAPAPGATSVAPGVRCTPAARRRLQRALQDRPGAPQAVWICRDPSGGFRLVLVDREATEGIGWRGSVEAPPLAWRTEDASALAGALVDHREGGFEVRLPLGDDRALEAEVRRVLETGVNPLVASHGGRILLVEAAAGVVRVRMEGGCQGCTAARETLSGVVSRHLLHAVPGLREVVDVTDHDAGEAPWYAPAKEGVISLPILPQGLREACR